MITFLSALIYGVIGLVIGSFLNVVILRRGAKTVGGRSGCLHCGTPLLWYDMIPVVSWIVLRGRCRSCGTRISAQYPLVEASTAVLFALIGPVSASVPLMLASLAIVALLVLIAVYDIRHTIIPDEWAYSFAILALIVASPFSLGQGWWGIVLLVCAGPLCALPLFVLWLISRGTWMGLGDVKLSLGIGWLLGIGPGLFALLASFVIGAAVSVCILLPLPYLRSKIGITRLDGASTRFTMKSEVPFGPFLVLGCLLTWVIQLYGIALPFFPYV